MLLRLKQKEQAVVSKYMEALVSDKIDDLPNITQTANIKGLSETVEQLTAFISREFQYYHLSRVNVSMFSTMSAEKSTFINALIVHDYLPAKNEACTAKIISVADIDNIDYSLGYVVKNGNLVVF